MNAISQLMNLNYKIIDMYGRTVKSDVFNNAEIDISQLPNGVYQFQLQTPIQQIGKRFLVVK